MPGPNLSAARTAAAAAALCAALPLYAQQSIVVTGRISPRPAIGGFGDEAPARTPLQASAWGATQLGDAGIDAISGLTRLDASIADAYNAEGYWSNLSARGFVLDSRFNYRRDGLPINAETAIALDNKAGVEVLKGTSGIQAGTSAPGGLVNLVVKRPEGRVRSAVLGFEAHGSVRAGVDVGEQIGALGVRLNAAHERLDPQVRNTRGQRSLLAVAADYRLAPGTLLQAEVETSRQRQPSVAGFSLLGEQVPAASAVDPRLNLNDQPWRQPVVLQGTTASLQLQQQLAMGWRAVAQLLHQRLKSDDRTAFPFGSYDAATYACAPCDRFAPDGTFTYWQFVSDDERRTSDAVQLAVDGKLQTGAFAHRVQAGVLRTRYRGRFQDQVFDIAGTGRIDGSLTTLPSAGGIDANTNRDERSTELFVRDAVTFSKQWQLWAGLRHVRLARAAERTSADSEGSLRATAYSRNATTPWLAVAWQWQPRTVLYTSWGRGLETDVAPSRARYANAGASIPLRSRQLEAGIKHGTERVEAALTLFDIDRGQTSDIGACNEAADSCTRRIDGSARHRGVEAQGALNGAAWSLQASALWLQARRRDSALAGTSGSRPTNVPGRSLRLGGEWRPLEDVALQAALVAEGDRVVLPYDRSARIPGWARLDLGARWRQPLGSNTLLWRAGVDNALGRRAWKEAPYQFGHAYLYPLAPRTWRTTVEAAF